MFRLTLTLSFILLLIAGCSSFQPDLAVSIIPQPLILTQADGWFEIKSGTPIITDGSESARRTAGYMADRLRHTAGWDLSMDAVEDAGKAIVLRLDGSPALGDEGYTFRSSPDGVEIHAYAAAGLFYGVQTLFQLLPPEIFSTRRADNLRWVLPSVVIEDTPRFPYRGMHLDVCRHFFSVDYVKQYIDYLAMHKLNRFHWHLTEDQGWRIEIKKYPRLQTIASRRKETVLGKTNLLDGKSYAGYYTQDEVRDVVAYAAERHITVIPEIEMPGHSVAALTAYPELSCNGGPFEVRTRWGISKDIYCAGNEKTFTFLEDVLTEVMDLFPSTYIHIGGDEAPKDRWNDCTLCRQRIRDEGLRNSHELQSYFIKRIENFLNANGRKLIGWDEILEGGLAPDATVMSWRGIAGGVDAARQGHDVIMTPYSHLYFDGYQADREIEPLAIGYWAPIEKVYSFEPVPSVLSPKEAVHIQGAQANLWTEYISTEEYADYMVLPRMSALAEVVWSSVGNRNIDDFMERIQTQYQRYSAMGASYRIPVPVFPNGFALSSGDTLTVCSGVEGAELRYTVDGSDPGIKSPVFKDLIVEDHFILKIQTLLPNGRASSIVTQPILVTDKAGQGRYFGLDYTVYTGKIGRFMPTVSQLREASSGSTFNLDLNDIVHPEDHFFVRFTGDLMIPADGTYTFYIRGDDGARLSIDGHRVVGHDQYARNPVIGNASLSAGAHPVVIKYFDNKGSHSLKLEIEGPGMVRQPVPPWMWQSLQESSGNQ
ncbi:family 20 glycosylhydrolase [bacterium]|nr:family 20 glycosylhydrolase [bacterium]